MLFEKDGCERGCTDCGESLLGEFCVFDGDDEYAVEVKAGGQEIDFDVDPDTNWDNDHLQFARLLAEALAVDAIKVSKALCVTMDLRKEQINEVLDRARSAWEDVVARTPMRLCALCGTKVSNRDVEFIAGEGDKPRPYCQECAHGPCESEEGKEDPNRPEILE